MMTGGLSLKYCLLSATLNMIPPNCAHNRRVAGGENVIFMCCVSHNVTSCLLMISLSSADNNSILGKHWDIPMTLRSKLHYWENASNHKTRTTRSHFAKSLLWSQFSLFSQILITIGNIPPLQSRDDTSHQFEVRVPTEPQVPWVPAVQAAPAVNTLTLSPTSNTANLESCGKWTICGNYSSFHSEEEWI